MKATYTPGPWTAYDDDGTGTLPCVLSASVNEGGNYYVAQCNNYADAMLISAVPELLAALIAAETCLHNRHVTTGINTAEYEALLAAREAIIKAVGMITRLMPKESRNRNGIVS